jgi:hypothetical protein
MEDKMNKVEEEILKNIITEFRQQKLLSEIKITEMERSIKSGKMTIGDWTILFDTDRPDTISGGIKNESK